ncbi:hypothetical protein [Pseudanabaena sp. FACHB-2040]|uniref:hypothetical protein n=1 Tax=Pseudanabaena sp. FACHB-2040 TaxID=2692859 RepID=UPI00168798D3|nr:hypothetical protein [Pseudanabaena sp. FACHB-2040]MBD2261401.1 hypothetical protein [Pseudanabaena sp. FACHB-2040]
MVSTPLQHTLIKERILANLKAEYPFIVDCSIQLAANGWQLGIRTDPMPDGFFDEMGNVLAIAERVAEFRTLKLNDNQPVEAEGLRAWCEQLFTDDSGEGDLKELCRFLMKDARQLRSIITISPSGVYLSFIPQQGQRSKVAPNELLGKTIAQVIGQTAHDEIISAVRRSQSTGQDQFCVYEAVFGDGERQRYTARVSAKPDGSLAWLAVTRLESISHD